MERKMASANNKIEEKKKTHTKTYTIDRQPSWQQQ